MLELGFGWSFEPLRSFRMCRVKMFGVKMFAVETFAVEMFKIFGVEMFKMFGVEMLERLERNGRVVSRSPRRSGPVWLCTAALFAALVTGPAQAADGFAKVGEAWTGAGEAITKATDAVGQAGAPVFDLVILRPLGVGKLVFGAACFIPAALFAELPGPGWSESSSIQDVWEVFVTEPFDSTFKAPLGEFEEEY